MTLRRIGQYALIKPGKEMLFNILSTDDKYKAKNFIDTVVYRLGDLLSAFLSSLLTSFFGILGTSFMGILLTCLWGSIGNSLAKEYRLRESEKTKTNPMQKV